jgi:hypothetical protein
VFSFELACRKCSWQTVSGPADAAARLRLVGRLRREKDPDEEILAQLLVETAPQMTCPGCKEKGSLKAVPSEDVLNEWEEDDWQAAILCDVCREPIPPERLEAVPESKRCVACQDKAETGTLPEDEPEFCPKCGALVELRVSRGSGITRYKQFCTGIPPCRL